MGLPPRYDLTNWSSEIGRQAEAEMNCTVQFYEEKQAEWPSVNTLTALLDNPVKARAQQLRAPSAFSAGGGLAVKRPVRIQIPLNATSLFLRKGLIVRVFGGNDPALPSWKLVIMSAVNSSHAALRTIECEGESVDFTWPS